MTSFLKIYFVFVVNYFALRGAAIPSLTVVGKYSF